jgi:hypothetical protein
MDEPCLDPDDVDPWALLPEWLLLWFAAVIIDLVYFRGGMLAGVGGVGIRRMMRRSESNKR